MLPGLLITIDLPHLTVVLRQDHTVTFRAARFLRSHVGKPDLPAENTHIDPQEFFIFFFVLEIALIATNRVAQSHFITRVLTLPGNHHPASHTLPEMFPLSVGEASHGETRQWWSGVVSHLAAPPLSTQWLSQRVPTFWRRLGSLSRRRTFPEGRQGAGEAYVWQADGADSDPLPSMLSRGGWQTCSQHEERLTLTCCQRVWWLTHAKANSDTKDSKPDALPFCFVIVS